MGSLCHFCATPTHLSYRFSILKLPPPPCAVLLVIYPDLWTYFRLVKYYPYLAIFGRSSIPRWCRSRFTRWCPIRLEVFGIFGLRPAIVEQGVRTPQLGSPLEHQWNIWDLLKMGGLVRWENDQTKWWIFQPVPRSWWPEGIANIIFPIISWLQHV